MLPYVNLVHRWHWAISTPAILALFCLCLAQPAFSSPPPPVLPGTLQALSSCLNTDWKSKFYAPSGENFPAPLAAVLAGPGAGWVARVCTDIDNNTHYFFRVPGETLAGVCEVFEEEFFPQEGGVMATERVRGTNDNVRVEGWTKLLPPEWAARGYPNHTDAAPFAMAQLHEKPCPRADDAGYIPITNVPPGLFKNIAQTLIRAASSDAEFAKAYAGTPLLQRPGFSGPDMLSARIGSVSCDDSKCTVILMGSTYVNLDVAHGQIVITRVMRIYY
jgi:hypothetical protein